MVLNHNFSMVIVTNMMINRYERVVINQNISLVIVSSEYDDHQV